MPSLQKVNPHDLDNVILIDTSCVAIKHQSAIANIWDKKSIGITPDLFGVYLLGRA